MYFEEGRGCAFQEGKGDFSIFWTFLNLLMFGIFAVVNLFIFEISNSKMQKKVKTCHAK